MFRELRRERAIATDARGLGGPARRHRSGLTLVELLIAIVVISVALGGTLLLSRQTVLRSADAMIQHQALVVATAYLEEIMLRAYLDPDTATLCPASEVCRALYDNVCDYAGLDDAGVVDQTGSSVSGLGDYRVRVDVDTTANLGGLSGSADVLRVDVRVTHPTGVDITLSGYRTAS